MSDLPPVPPVRKRLLRLPRELARQVRWSADLKVRRLRARRSHAPLSKGLLWRAWARTDPVYRVRLVEELRGRLVIDASGRPARMPPAPGTVATIVGTLNVDHSFRGVLLDDEEIDTVLCDALGLSDGDELRVTVLDEIAGVDGR